MRSVWRCFLYASTVIVFIYRSISLSRGKVGHICNISLFRSVLPQYKVVTSETYQKEVCQWAPYPCKAPKFTIKTKIFQPIISGKEGAKVPYVVESTLLKAF